MRKVLSAAAALGVCLTLPAAALAGAGMSDEQILQELEYLRTKVASQQEHIDALGAMVDKKVSAKVEEEVKKVGGSGGSSKVALANEFIDQLTLKGDLRVRYEKRDLDYYAQANTADVARDRLRTRFRLGGVWENKAENWEVGAGLATGEAANADGSHLATSTNGTWSKSSAFQSNDLWLDYAYASHKVEDFKFTIGQQLNPYETSWVLWDSDVRLAGLTAQYGKKEGVFATVGGYGAKLVNDDNTAMLYMGQAGYRGKVGDVAYTLAAGYQKYDQSFINDKANTVLNTVDPAKYALEIGDLYGKVSFPVSSVKLSLYGHIWQNFGADGNIGQSQAKDFPKQSGDADLGWVVGLDAKIDKIRLGYAYAVVEADSLYGALTDSDFGDGISTTNKKGHRVQAGYDFTKNWAADFTWMNYKQDEAYYSANNKVDSVDLYQFDVSYKF